MRSRSSSGKAPADWTPPDFKLDDFTLPQEIPASLPSELVHQRPDILAAEAQLHMASAAIGVATANLYPNINLTGALTQEALTPGGLFNSVAAAWSLAANLTQPLLTADSAAPSAAPRSTPTRRRSRHNRQTIIKAFGEVADRRRRWRTMADQVRAQTEAVQTATASLDLQRRSYAVGNSGILDVIDAQRSAAQAEIGLVRARGTTPSGYRTALHGAWGHARPGCGAGHEWRGSRQIGQIAMRAGKPQEMGFVAEDQVRYRVKGKRKMSHEQLSIRTRDGECPAHVFTPKGAVPWPAAIFYMDGLGIRPALFEMGQRLADGGYVVLLPDLYYRAGPYAPLEPKAVFASGDVMGAIGHLFRSTDNRRAAEDTEAFLAYLDTREDISGSKVGTTGYCMGGAISLTVAGTYPDRIAAAASFHGATWQRIRH